MRAVQQALMLRGSREFSSRDDYAAFLRKLYAQLNAGRQDRLSEELKELGALPHRRLDSSKRLGMRVGPSSTIRVNKNVYSVDSRLIAEKIEVRLYAEQLQVWYAQRLVDTIPRLRGEGRHRIEYRHIIDWLVRKPGAFENYRYRQDLFPTHRFRVAYDWLKQRQPARASKKYLEILYLAAKENETAVDDALRTLINQDQPIELNAVQALVYDQQKVVPATEVNIADIDLAAYDTLLAAAEVAPC